MEIDEQLRVYESAVDSNWQRLSFILRKHLDIWAHKNIKTHWGQMKMSYMPVISNISIDGSTNIEIASKSMTVKQSMSRTIKELEEKGMIVTKRRKDDKRSDKIELTQSGKQFIVNANQEMAKLQETYKELVGEKDLAIAVEVIKKIINYHEQLNLNDDHLSMDDIAAE